MRDFIYSSFEIKLSYKENPGPVGSHFMEAVGV
jgi:hypothetical protein